MASESAQTTFGKYRLLGRIAAGGMAELHKARLEGPGGFQKTFAIKRLLPALASNPEFVAMLVDEAKIAGLLSHANIVQILDLGAVDGVTYIAMEYVDGPDLAVVLAAARTRGVTTPIPVAIFITLEVLKGLDYAHARSAQRDGATLPLQIVHRDIAPGNILLSQQGEVKIADFGIAKASVKALETMSGVIKGRFDYMSPEQARGKGVDGRSDLFSVGVLLYELLTGRNPFARAREADTMLAIRDGRYEGLRHVRPELPVALDVIVSRLLEVDPARRFPTAGEAREALERFAQKAGVQPSAEALTAWMQAMMAPEPPPPPPPQRYGDVPTIVRKAPQAAPPVEAPPTRAPRQDPPPPEPPPPAQEPPLPRAWLFTALALALGLALLTASAGFFLGVRYGRAQVLNTHAPAGAASQRNDRP